MTRVCPFSFFLSFFFRFSDKNGIRLEEQKGGRGEGLSESTGSEAAVFLTEGPEMSSGCYVSHCYRQILQAGRISCLHNEALASPYWVLYFTSDGIVVFLMKT